VSSGPIEPAEPLVSVVIACVNGLPAIAECLEALGHQEGSVGCEALVMDRCGAETREALRARFPWATIVAVEGRPSVPALRAMGIARARGHLVAILEDHCNVSPRWLQVIERAHRSGHRVLGGAVENGSVERTVDWAVFFCEYARFMPPLPRGVVDEITGNNSVYERELLKSLGGEQQDEVWEWFLHSRLRERGVRFYCEPEMVVSHKKEFGFGYFLRQRYYYSRSFAGMRLRGAPLWKRLTYTAGTPLLPALLFVRLLACVGRKRRYWPPFARAAPVLATFLVSGAWGEAVGALMGPGTSLEKVE
jgi:GT2 family glycosyltransferase